MKSELTQIREGNRRVHNWRIVACVLCLVALYALMGKLDSDARLDELERIALRHAPAHPTLAYPQAARPEPSTPSAVRPELVEGLKVQARITSMEGAL